MRAAWRPGDKLRALLELTLTLQHEKHLSIAQMSDPGLNRDAGIRKSPMPVYDAQTSRIVRLEVFSANSCL